MKGDESFRSDFNGFPPEAKFGMYGTMHGEERGICVEGADWRMMTDLLRDDTKTEILPAMEELINLHKFIYSYCEVLNRYSAVSSPPTPSQLAPEREHYD